MEKRFERLQSNVVSLFAEELGEVSLKRLGSLIIKWNTLNSNGGKTMNSSSLYRNERIALKLFETFVLSPNFNTNYCEEGLHLFVKEILPIVLGLGRYSFMQLYNRKDKSFFNTKSYEEALTKEWSNKLSIWYKGEYACVWKNDVPLICDEDGMKVPIPYMYNSSIIKYNSKHCNICGCEGARQKMDFNTPICSRCKINIAKINGGELNV